MKTKKILFAMSMIAVMAAGAMALSAFTTSKHDATQVGMNADDNWKVFREKVPYCDGDKDVCMGYGKVWVNTETYQVAFEPDCCSRRDLSEYTGKTGYNMRFWADFANPECYYYVNIYIPRSAFE